MPLNIDFQQILLHMLNFVVLFFALYFLLYSPVRKFMDNRGKDVEKKLSDADKKSEEAERLIKEYTEKIAGADAEIEAGRKKILGDAEKAREDMIAGAKAEAEKILSDSRAQAKEEYNALMRQANHEIKELTREAADGLMLNSSSDAYKSFFEAAANKDSAKNG